MARAYYSRQRLLLVFSLLFFGAAVWIFRHAYKSSISPDVATVTWLLLFFVLAWTTLTALVSRPFRAAPDEQKTLDKLNVAVLVPVYNEDPVLLRKCINSILTQSRRVQSVLVVDDGSTVDYSEVARVVGRRVQWTRTANHGKRHAQAVGIRQAPRADIYVTVDSDTVLDHDAIAEGLQPFVDPSMASVAGLVLAINNDKNILTRFTGVWELNWQLLDRGNQSLFNSVSVNSGPLALYRGYILRMYLKSYLSETFFDRPVQFSDDSLMTLYCMQHGRTVQQPTALAFSATPEKYGHNVRRYLRWMRGSFIRSWWRLKYLPLSSYAFFMQSLRWTQTIVSTAVLVYLFATSTNTIGLLGYMAAAMVAISYGQSLVYFCVKRSDQSWYSKLLNFVLAPLAYLWLGTVLRAVRWYGYMTCYRTGWGTRKTVEVSA